jgi:ankyrin repeat protein
MASCGFEDEGEQCLVLSRSFWADTVLQGALSKHAPAGAKGLGQTRLMCAAAAGNVPRLQECLRHGALVLQRDRYEEAITSLHWAAKCNQPRSITALLAAPAPHFRGRASAAPVAVEARDAIYDGTPLHWAAFYGATEAVAALLAGGADIGARSGRGLTALSIACWQGRSATALALLDAGSAPASADVDGEGKTALHWAAHSGMVQVAKRLIASAADAEAAAAMCNLPDESYGMTPLLYAAGNGQCAMIELLLSHGADARARATDSDSALHLASQKGAGWGAAAQRRAMGALVAAGALPNARNEGGATPLAYACWRGTAAAATFLLDRGADVSSLDHDQDTPLLLAAQRKKGFERVTLALLKRLEATGAAERSAQLNAHDGGGFTPLVFAAHTQPSAALAMLGMGARDETVVLRNSKAFAHDGRKYAKGLVTVLGARFFTDLVLSGAEATAHPTHRALLAELLKAD